MNKIFLSLFFLTVTFRSFSSETGSKQILMRVPLLSDKNALLIANSLDTIQGVQNIEFSFDIHVMIITYYSKSPSTPSDIAGKLNQLEINTPFEEISEKDIPVIRKNYKIVSLKSPPGK